MSDRSAAPKILGRVSRIAGTVTAAAVVCAAVAWIGFRAVEPAHAQPPRSQTAPAHPNSLPPLQDSSAIHDDPTVAPDPKQSADNNVSLPADI